MLFDIFLTVLYARAGTSILGKQVCRAIWWGFRQISEPFGRRRGEVLSFCGPAILVGLVLSWSIALALGAALIIHPHLGSEIRLSSGKTPTDFMSALYAGGTSLSFVGSSDFKPQSPGSQAFYLFNSLVGMSVMSVVLTYVMQIYSALKHKNTLGLGLYTLAGNTGDAAELVAGLGPRGQFQAGFTNLSNLASEVMSVKEAHHFYPVLFYFRFPEPYYSVSQSTTMLLDTASLIKSGIDDDEYGWLKESAVVAQCWHSSVFLVRMLEEVYLPGHAAKGRVKVDSATRERWRTRYFAALERFRQAGIKTIADPSGGFEIYVALRERWDANIARLRASMLFDPADIDTPTHRPDLVRARPPFEHRLHDV